MSPQDDMPQKCRFLIYTLHNPHHSGESINHLEPLFFTLGQHAASPENVFLRSSPRS